MINQVAKTSIIKLRGGGCGSGKIAIHDPSLERSQFNRELPSNLLSITQAKVKSLQTKMLTIADKSVQDEYLNTINWLDINEYWYQRIPDDKSNMIKCIKLLQLTLKDILEIVESIIDGSRFIAYSLIRVANNFSRIMVVYYTQNEGLYLDLELSNGLKERISSIKEIIEKSGETALYYNGLQYESGITEACINICPVDDPEGRELGLKALIEIVKSAASFSPSEELFSSLGDLVIFGVKALYQKYKESNFKEMMTKCLFIEQFKWTVVTSIEKKVFSMKSIFNTLANFYKKEVLYSKSWEVKYCWIKANHWIMAYRIILTKEMLNSQRIQGFDSFWYQLISQQLISLIDRSDHGIGAILNENLFEKLDLSGTNPIYPNLKLYIRSINRIKAKILEGSEKLPKLLHYDQEFSNNDKSDEANRKILELQDQLQYFNIHSVINQFTQVQSSITNLLVYFSDMADQIKDLNQTDPDKDNIIDICQQGDLIAKLLLQLKEMIINLRISVIQFKFVAENFIEAMFEDSQLKQDHSEQKQIINCQITLSQIRAVLLQFRDSKTQNVEQQLQNQITLINYITKLLQDMEKEQPSSQRILSDIKLQQLQELIRSNSDLTKNINKMEEISLSLLKGISTKHLDIIRIVSFLQISQNSLNSIDRYMEEIQQMYIQYTKLSFIPIETLKSNHALQQSDIKQYTTLTSIHLELKSSECLFNEISKQFQKILSNKSSFDKIYILLNKQSVQLLPTTKQNRLIIQEAISLEYKHLAISKAMILSESIQLQTNYSFQHMEGILDIQTILIQQEQIIAQKLQQIIQNSLTIYKVYIEDTKQNDLLVTLKQSLEQTLTNINQITLIKFQDLLNNLLNEDDNYLLQFMNTNYNAGIKDCTIEMLNEDLLKKLQLPQIEYVEQQQSDSEEGKKICESYRNNLNNLLDQIRSTINNEDISIIRRIVTTKFLNSLLIHCTLPVQTIKNFISTFQLFNNIDLKNQIQLDILASKLVTDIKFLVNNIEDNTNSQQINESSNNLQEQIQPSIDITFFDEISEHKETYKTYQTQLKQIIEIHTKYEFPQEVPKNNQIQKMDQIINKINKNFEHIMNIEFCKSQLSEDSKLEATGSKVELTSKIQNLLQSLNISQNISQDQMIQCFGQNQKSIISLESNENTEGDFWRLRECQLFNILITQQRLINSYQIAYSEQLIIFKAIETDNRIQKVLKNTDFIVQQQSALEKHWKQQANSIQQMISRQLGKLQQLQKQIQSQQPGPDRDQLQLDHEALETQIEEQIENVCSIGNSLGITIAFIKDLKKELLIIQDQLKEINSKLNDMSLDIKFLIGKSPQQLLEIRMENILKQQMIDDARSVFVQLYTKEMIDFNGKLEAEEETPLSNSVEEQNGEIDQFIKSQNQKSLLVHGPAGSGKSTAAKKAEEYLWTIYKQQKISKWDEVKEPPIIPIFIQLPTLKDPKFKALQETLKSQAYLFNDKQIMDLQKYVLDKKIKLFIIMDSYDELNRHYIEQNLNITNKFDQWCDSQNYQILNTTRSEIFTTKTEYRSWFTATNAKPSKENFKEIRILSFNNKQRDRFYDQYCKLSLKQVIIDIYDILFEQKNKKVDTALIINELWEQIISVFNSNHFNQEKLLDSDKINSIIQLIISAQNNKIDLYKDQEIHLRQQLHELWSPNEYKKNIHQLEITNLVETPYMTNIVVQVLPQLIEEFSSQDHLKLVFIRNIEAKLNRKKGLIVESLKSNEIWDLLIESKALLDYKITNTKISMNIFLSISNELDTKLQNLIEQNINDEYRNLVNSLQDAVKLIKGSQYSFNLNILISIIENRQHIIQDQTIKLLLQILLYKSEIIESIQQNQPTSYDFYKLFLSEYINKQIRKLSYKQVNFQTSKYLENASQYVQNLGTFMTANQLTSIEYHQKGIVEQKSKDNYQDQIFQLFDDNADHASTKVQIRTSIPLKVRGESYSFFHKSIQEYLFAKSFIDLLEFMKQLKNLGIVELFAYRKQQGYTNDWSYSEVKSYEEYRKQSKVKGDQVKKIISCLDYLRNHLINSNIYQDEFFIGSINFIANKIKQNFDLIQTLIILLQISKLGNSLQNCTSNCLHIAKISHIPLTKRDLSGIHVNKISIRNMVLRQADLSYTTFSKVDINGINLVDANLTHCKWTKLTTNELPIVNVGSKVYCIAYSPNNCYLASGNDDQTVRIWDAQSGKQIGESLIGHAGSVFSVSYSPDGKFIASGSLDKTVRIWDAQSGKQIGESLNGHTDQVESVSYSPDGKFIASGSDDRTVRIWDAQSGKQIGESLNGHASSVFSVSYSPDGRFITSGSSDNTVRIWDAKSGKQIRESLNGHTDYVRSVTYSPDGKFIASASDDKTVRIWDAQSGKQIGETLNGHTSSVYSVQYSPDGKFIASASSDRTVRIWDPQTGKEIGESLIGHTDYVRSVSYSPDGKFISSGSYDKTMKIWDAKFGKQTEESLNSHTGSVFSVLYSHNGEFIVSGSEDNTVRIWDAQSGKQIGESLMGHTGLVYSVSYSPDGEYIVSGSQDKTLRIWGAKSGKQIRESLNGHTDCVRSVSYSPDGKFIVSGSEDKTVRIWNAKSGKQIGESLIGHTGDVCSVSYSPDGKFIASGSSDKTVRIWDAQSGKQIGESLNGHTDSVRSVIHSPDGKFIVSGSQDKTIRIWDAQSGKQIGESLNGHTDYVRSVTYSPDGKFIASASDDKTVRIWDAQSGKQIGESLNGHTDYVSSVSFSTDGRFIASGSDDKTVRIWEVLSKKQVGEYSTSECNKELFEKIGIDSKDCLLQFNNIEINKKVHQCQLLQDRKNNQCVLRIPNKGSIMYHGCNVFEAKIESRLGINVLQLWSDRQNEIP